jgi:hypothetical protein
MYLMNYFRYLMVSSLLLTCQLPTLSTLVFRVSRSFFSLLQQNIRWCTVCMPCLHGHSGLPIIFNRCEYDRIFPWPVIIVVTFGLKFKFIANLLSTFGKNSLVIAPFVVSSQLCCHFLMLSFQVSFFIALFGILLYVT